MDSRADDRMSWPNTVEVHWPRKVSSDWATTTPMMTSARVATFALEELPATVLSIRSPSSRGTSSPVAAASALNSTMAANTPRRSLSNRPRNSNTAALSATGQPRSGARDRS